LNYFLKQIRREKLIFGKINFFSHEINLKLKSITIKICNQQPQLSNDSSDTTVGFLNIIHAAKTMKQSYLEVPRIPLDKFKVV
jgi:hypothetical protein